jgi:hypothetical protein
VDEVLGYDDWDTYVGDRFGDLLKRLSPASRRAVVEQLATIGMSQRVIAVVVGVDKETVRRDLATGGNAPLAKPEGARHW